MTDLEYFRARYGLGEAEVLLFPFGSRVYGTARADSDYDYLAVVPEGRRASTGEEFRHGTANVTLFTRGDWAEQLAAHKIHCLEAYYLPDGVCRAAFPFRLDRHLLYAALFDKASRSWARARNKMEAEGQPLLAWKGVFHALRILHFGIQIATTGGIIDYGGANPWWREILTTARTDWAWHEERFGPEWTRLSDEFRRATET
jgi:hypothetical protein